jgi:hypothetical protein
VKTIPLILLILVLATGCAPDPRNQADANATQLKAEAQAAADAQARAQAQAKFDLEHQEAEARSAQWIASVTQFIRNFMFVATIAACVAVLGIGIGTGWGAAGIGKAVANKAMNVSNQIQMSEKTRQFPLFIQHVGNGLFTMYNPNTGEVARLDVRKAADRQQIATQGALLLASGVAHEARMHRSDPTGVAMVGTHPTIVDVNEQLPGGGFLNIGSFAKAEVLMSGQEDDNG